MSQEIQANSTKKPRLIADALKEEQNWIYQFILYFWFLAVVHAVVWPTLSYAYHLMTEKVSSMLAGTGDSVDAKNIEENDEVQESLELCEKQAKMIKDMQNQIDDLNKWQDQ